jgi:TonB family protein
MYFDFEDYRPDITPVGRAISWREGILISLILHLAAVVVLISAPALLGDASAAAPREAFLRQDREDEPTRFVVVNPRVDLKALAPPERAEASDQDRVARAPDRAPRPDNPLPRSRGNSSERVEREDREVAKGEGPAPDPSVGQQARVDPQTQRELELPEDLTARTAPPSAPQNRDSSGVAPGGGSLGEALRNLGRYVERSQFDNPQGGANASGPTIQFDTKGVEFGPWVRRFVAQVKGNWLIPLAAMSMKGHVVLTFNVHKNGALTDLAIVQPCPIDAFNNAAYGALAASNPTQPLPPEYPADKAFFTVTFFYNESPP